MMSPMPSPSLPATVDASELAGRLRLSVTRLARQLRQTADTDLSPTQGAVLATISNHGPLTLGELAERERVARSEERRVGKEGGSQCRSWWMPDHSKKKKKRDHT